MLAVRGVALKVIRALAGHVDVGCWKWICRRFAFCEPQEWAAPGMCS
jgi:hypothetical protein